MERLQALWYLYLEPNAVYIVAGIALVTLCGAILGQLADNRHERRHRERQEEARRIRRDSEALLEKFRHPPKQ